MNAKDWARSKRKRRFGGQRHVRKSDPNGHTVRRSIFSNCRDGGIKKIVQNWGGSLHTGFEESLGFELKVNETYSMNRHKRWEQVNAHIQHSECDEVWNVERGHLGFDDNGRSRDAGQERVFLAYFDLEELEDAFSHRFGERKHRAEALGSDSLYVSSHRQHLSWLTAQQKQPKNVQSPLLPIVAFRPSSVSKACVIRRACVNSFGQWSFWAPKQVDNAEDVLDIDLGRLCDIEAVSTRGRPLRRDRTDNYVPAPGWPVEFVKKYKLFYKTDTHEPWIQLGDVWNGNRDSETEVVHRMKSCSEMNSVGLKARYLRFQPLSSREDGFFGRKSIRIGVYGKACDSKQVEMTLVKNHEANHGRKGLSRKLRRKIQDLKVREERMETRFADQVSESAGCSDEDEDEDEKGDTRDESDWRKFATRDHNMTRKDTSKAVISVQFGSASRNWGHRNYDGVFCQGCGMCRQETYENLLRRRKKRRSLKQRTRKEWAETARG